MKFEEEYSLDGYDSTSEEWIRNLEKNPNILLSLQILQRMLLPPDKSRMHTFIRTLTCWNVRYGTISVLSILYRINWTIMDFGYLRDYGPKQSNSQWDIKHFICRAPVSCYPLIGMTIFVP